MDTITIRTWGHISEEQLQVLYSVFEITTMTKGLLNFLRFGLTSANTLGKFQKNMNPEKMPLSSAYILNEINKAGSKKSNTFRI